jgi:hypothetical protein
MIIFPVLVPPQFERFYLYAQRPVFLLWKQAPDSTAVSDLR